jgi:hypothetical protein
MKKILMAAAMLVAGLITAGTASARGFGVTGGFNFNSVTVEDLQMDTRAGFNLGVTYLLDLPLGLSVQPSLLYSQNSLDYSTLESIEAMQKVGSVKLPVSVQWGPDLIIARPFIDVTPYLGYTLSNKLEGGLKGVVNGETSLENTFEYGVGLGAGVNIWKLQAIVRYNWNFGLLGKLEDFKNLGIGDFKTENDTYGGVTVSVAYFF